MAADSSAEPVAGATAENAPDAAPDAFLGGRLTLFQPAAGYRAAIDSVLLAAAVPAAPGERLLELGLGSGAAALCLLARVPGCRVVGLELQPLLAALARRNAATNGLAGRLEVVEGDLRRLPAALGRGYDRVFANPPFHEAASPAPDAQRAAAHHLAAGSLADWVGAALRCLRPRGTLSLILRADRLPEVLAALAGRAGDLRLLPLWPKPQRPARRLLLQARKGARAPLTLLPGMLLHEPDGRFTLAAEAVLRDAAALPLAAEGPADA
ncbi:tRNA1(Val) A37 N6-methylase TrmN6 [Tistlia consotensis]|uniref:tRNA1(Val) A37 N6-methylase TrmN6 n=1 Tax=Tistlia consotensis USBA 355 TaxID=560819 RepID=A0A1Y6B8A0_9PROT|nr:methyltransferase domain-containing protein [Tistlia consotensis]SME89583.1 tRNA1(Val) A37 N6-methylase TrmN6 [Tistlia consotensis USBA 355]SNR26088.1 tRNA1(Val) A37 N6-methylase TrmN6 [Tistlia consotensis]